MWDKVWSTFGLPMMFYPILLMCLVIILYYQGLIDSISPCYYMYIFVARSYNVTGVPCLHLHVHVLAKLVICYILYPSLLATSRVAIFAIVLCNLLLRSAPANGIYTKLKSHCTWGILNISSSFRNISLRQKVKALKKKEAEEAKALEEMVLKVESNLEATTVRII